VNDRETLRAPDWVQEHLLHWYRETRREMPWRSDPSPYHVFLSELMLQQTRVETVIPYFRRFTQRWPRLHDLARASEEEVLQEWAGLGYYSRARNLLRAAQSAVAQGGLPSSAAELRKLPGIGPYTAGAIASIAFGLPEPLVDGNVERVLCRLDGLGGDPKKGPTRKALWARAAELVPEDQPGDFNQALMELGALVCSPKKPKCGACPLSGGCVAVSLGQPERFPETAPRKKPKPVQRAVAVIRKGKQVLLAKRPDTGLLAGMWELPGGEVTEEGVELDALVDTLHARLGFVGAPGVRLGTVVHTFTHLRMTLHVYEFGHTAKTVEPHQWYTGVCWTSAGQARELGLTTYTRKVLSVAFEEGEQS